jgi:hypothetical protein
MEQIHLGAIWGQNAGGIAVMGEIGPGDASIHSHFPVRAGQPKDSSRTLGAFGGNRSVTLLDFIGQIAGIG